MVHSISLKFGMYNIGHRHATDRDFSESRNHKFFTGLQKRMLTHYSPWILFIESVLKPSIELKFDMHS